MSSVVINARAIDKEEAKVALLTRLDPVRAGFTSRDKGCFGVFGCMYEADNQRGESE
jgi:hypothetical protein